MTTTSYTIGGDSIAYEYTDSKYVIYRNGYKWITQDGFFPYSGDTIEDKCINHIVDLVNAEETETETTKTYSELLAELTTLKSNQALLDESICELTEYIASL